MHKKISYKRIFQGIEQFGDIKSNTILHCWYDKDKTIGGRKDVLKNFLSQLDQQQRNISCISFSECDFDVSVDGYFDLIENVFSLRTDNFSKEMVMNSVFTDRIITTEGEWGEGINLPSIDIERRNNAPT